MPRQNNVRTIQKSRFPSKVLMAENVGASPLKFPPVPKRAKARASTRQTPPKTPRTPLQEIHFSKRLRDQRGGDEADIGRQLMNGNGFAPVPGGHQSGERRHARGKIKTRGHAQKEKPDPRSPQAVAEAGGQKRQPRRPWLKEQWSFCASNGWKQSPSPAGRQSTREDNTKKSDPASAWPRPRSASTAGIKGARTMAGNEVQEEDGREEKQRFQPREKFPGFRRRSVAGCFCCRFVDSIPS